MFVVLQLRELGLEVWREMLLIEIEMVGFVNVYTICDSKSENSYFNWCINTFYALILIYFVDIVPNFLVTW